MPAPASSTDLLDLVRKSGIVAPDQLREQLEDTPNLPPDAIQSAAVLVQKGIITRFQAQLLLNGRYRGFKLGPYVVREQVGRGGMGAVYLAEHESLRRRVAVKVLTPLKGDAEANLAIERFLREARAAAALDHPNIVRLHDVGRQAEVHYLVLEYVDGKTLEEMSSNSGAIPPGRAVGYIAQAAAGLQHAYERGFVHRDIKPANLMLAKDGTVKILDMGLARSCTADRDRLTERLDVGAIVGTADYISPEQALDSGNIDIRSDIYSLGATLYALVTGKPPFTGNTSQKLTQHQLKDATPLDRIDKTVPAELARVVEKMMAKKPDKRYQTPAQVIRALAPWLGDEGAKKLLTGLSSTELGDSMEMQHTISELAATTTSRMRRSKRLGTARRPWGVWAGAAAAVVAAIGAVAYFTVGGSGDKAKETAANPNPPAATGTTPAAAVNPPAAAPTGRPRQSRQPVAAVAPAAGRLHVTDFAGTDVVEQTIDTPNTAVSQYALGGVQLPPGVRVNHWNKQAAAVYSVADVGGTRAFGMRPTADAKGVQVHFACGDRLTGLPAGDKATVRLTYALDGSNPGIGFVEVNQEPYSKYAETPLPPTDGKWQTVELAFARPAGPAGGEYALVVRASTDTAVVNGTLWVKAVELIDPTAAAAPPPAAAAAYQVDFRSAETVTAKFRNKVGWEDGAAASAIHGLPGGFTQNHYNESADADYMVADVDGGRALGLRLVAGGHGCQVKTRAGEPFGIVKVGETMTVRVEYRTDGTAAGMAVAQLDRDPWDKPAKTALAPTNGAWKTAEFQFTRTDDAPYALVLNSREGGTVWVKSVSAWVGDPAAGAAPPVPAAPPLFRLAADDVPPFRNTKDGFNLTAGSKEALPRRVYFAGHRVDTRGEYFCEEVDGRPALGWAHLGGSASGQIGVELEHPSEPPLAPLAAGRKYTTRITYKTVGGSHGASYVQTHGDYAKVAGGHGDLPDTGGEWKTVEYTWSKPEKTVRLVVDNRATGAAAVLYVREVAVSAAGGPAAPPAAAGGKVIYQLDLSAQKAFADRGQTDATGGSWKWASDKKVGDGALPAGWVGYPWKLEDTAEYFADDAGGRMAVGLRTVSGAGSAMLLSPPVEVPGKKARVRVEYRTEAGSPAAGLLRFKATKPTARGAFDVKSLPPTNGEWATVVADADLKGGTAGVFEIHNNVAGPNADIRVAAFVVTDPSVAAEPAAAATAPAIPTGPPVLAFDFGDVPPVRYTYADGKPSAEAAGLPAGVVGNNWKTESVTEFRAAAVAGRTGFGMTNLNTENTGQIQFGELSKLAAGKRYRARVEYLTQNDAAGRLAVRKPEANYAVVGEAALPATAGRWSAATVEFVAPAGDKLDAVITTNEVGEGNTLYVGKVEFFEVK